MFHRTPFSDQSSSSSPIHLHSVLCDGTESNITSCSHSLVSSADSTISHRQDVFVVCRPRRDQQSYSGGNSFIIVYAYMYKPLQPAQKFNVMCSCSSWWCSVWRYSTVWRRTLGMAMVPFKSMLSHWVGREYAPTTPGLTVMQQLSVGT